MARRGRDERRRKRQADARRRHARRTTPPHSAPEGPGPGELFTNLASALADPDPIAFLALASTLAHTLDPRAEGPLDAEPLELEAGEFVEMLSHTPAPESAALLHAFSVLLPDEVTAAKARRGALRQIFPLPEWLTRLRETTVTSTSVLTDELGDAENINVSLRLVTGEEITVLVLVDHNLNSAAKDGFMIPGGLAGLRREFTAAAEGGPHVPVITEIDPADARARLESAIRIGAIMYPPLESESWPQARPLVKWAMRMLPTGGTGYDTAELAEPEQQALIEDFMTSPEAAHLTGTDDSEVVGNLLWFTGYTGGDPLRWSPVNVGYLMEGWFTRKVLAPKEYLLRLPVVLEAFVRYAHRVRGISQESTAATLQAVAAMTPGYVDLVNGGGGRPRWMDDAGPGLEGAIESGDMSALHAALDLPDTGPGSWRWLRAVEQVGSEGALNRLTPDPLPIEEFDWEGIDGDIRPRVEAILDLCDSTADAFFDVEYRTAFRRVLARTARADPAVFRRPGKDETAAAAVVWVVAAANERLRPIGDLTAKEVFTHLGVTGNVNARARPFLRAYGAGENQLIVQFALGSPEVLTSTSRARLIAIRDGSPRS